MAAACLFVGCAIAQAPTATLVGRVVHIRNAPVTGAAVSVRSQGTNQIRTVETQADGQYTVSALSPGPYEVTITIQGFRAPTEPRVVLHADQSPRVECRVERGAVAEKVEVQSSVTVLNTENATLGDVVIPAQIAEIIKMVARRQIESQPTPDRQKWMDQDIDNVSMTGKSGGGKKGAGKSEGAHETGSSADPLADEEMLSKAVMAYSAQLPDEKRAIVLSVKKAARADSLLPLMPEQRRQLDAEILALSR